MTADVPSDVDHGKLWEEKTGEKGRRRELPDAKLHPLHAHLPPSLSHIRMLAFLPISLSSLPPPPTSSLFTLHRHPFRNMLLPQQQGGKASSASLTTRRCSDCHNDCSTLWLKHTQFTDSCMCKKCPQKRMHNLKPTAERHNASHCWDSIPSQNGHTSSYWCSAEGKYVAENRGREGNEKRRWMQRLLVTQHFIDILPHFRVSSSHYPETFLDTINPARHHIISRKDTDCTYTSRRDVALPPSYPNLLPVRVVTATRLQLYDPTLRNKHNAVHAAWAKHSTINRINFTSKRCCLILTGWISTWG